MKGESELERKKRERKTKYTADERNEERLQKGKAEKALWYLALISDTT